MSPAGRGGAARRTPRLAVDVVGALHVVGTLLAWAALAAARRPPAAVTSGLVVWLGALVGGMVLRQASGQGTATAFVVVATLVLGAFLVLPRVGARIGARAGARAGR